MEFSLLRGRVGTMAVVGLLALLLFCGAYAVGLIQTLGYENRHITFSGFASGTEAGGSFGLKDMVFFEGQTFFAEYDAEVTEGVFEVRVSDLFGPIGDSFVEYIEDSRRGEVTYRIPETGFYTIDFDGTVGIGDDGYEIAYSVRWGAR